MATYKKKFKPANKTEENNIEEARSATAEVFNTLDERASRTEAWVAKNQKYIFGGIVVVVVAVLGYLGYQQFILGPKEKEASNELFFAQQYFDEAVNATDKDSLYNLALKGANGKYGLLDIIDKYSGTKAANLARYSAGMSYLNIGKNREAIEQLEKFSSKDPILGALALGGIADAFLGLNQKDEALNYYEKAFKHNVNGFTTPRFLQKAGELALELGQREKAIGYFNRIKDEFKNSEEGRKVDFYLGMAESMQ